MSSALTKLDKRAHATQILSGGGNGVAISIDVATGQTLETMRGHTGPILAVAFDSTTALTASTDGTIRQWVLSLRDEGRLGAHERTRHDKHHIIKPGEGESPQL